MFKGYQIHYDRATPWPRLALADPNDAAGPAKSGSPGKTAETVLFPSTWRTGWWLEHGFYFPMMIGNVIILTD